MYYFSFTFQIAVVTNSILVWKDVLYIYHRTHPIQENDFACWHPSCSTIQSFCNEVNRLHVQVHEGRASGNHFAICSYLQAYE